MQPVAKTSEPRLSPLGKLNAILAPTGWSLMDVTVNTETGFAWSQVCAAHVAELEVGSHPFSRVTGIFAGDDGHKPVRRDHRLARPTTDPSVLSAPGGLKPCAILQDWVDFCDDVVFATVKHFKTVEISLSQLREQAPQVWGIESEQALDAIRCRDRLEEITEVTGKLDSAALGKVLATAKALLSTQMLAVS